MIIDRCTFQGNAATIDSSALGGAFKLDGGTDVVISNSTFSFNRSYGQGGAYFYWGSNPLAVVNSTFYGNCAADNDSSTGFGGAASGATTKFLNTTIAANFAGHGGGGTFVAASSSLENCILAYNRAGNPWNIEHNCNAALADSGHNIQYTSNSPGNANATECTPTILLADPLLDTLVYSGGFTKTAGLKAGSPAIDAASNDVQFDQRGFPRNGQADIGAFEVQ
jgi:hypothetical protein